MQAIFGSIKITNQINLLYTHYPLASKVLRALIHNKISKLADAHFTHSSTRVSKRLEKGRDSEGVDLWDLVLQSEDKGKGLTRAEMNANSSLFMVAGTETTATLLSGLTYLLLSQEGNTSLRKLIVEIRGAFTSSDDISMEATQALPYMNSCLKEALRMYPPIPIGLPHRTPKQGSTVCGYFIPPDVSSIIHR